MRQEKEAVEVWRRYFEKVLNELRRKLRRSRRTRCAGLMRG